MIDFHTHILPMMDDGARNVKESMEMIALLKAQGVTLAVLTPHFYPQNESLTDFINRRRASYQFIARQDLDMIVGSEAYLAEPLLSYPSIQKLCIGETNYLLLELPYTDKWGSSIFRQIDHLMAKYQVRPIIAHVERYRATQHNSRQILQQLVDLGCLLQFNIDSVVDMTTRRTTLKLIKEGWVDVVGSDCHNLTSRPPRFDAFNEIIRKKLKMDGFKGTAINLR